MIRPVVGAAVEEAAEKLKLGSVMSIVVVLAAAAVYLGLIPSLSCGLIELVGPPDLAWYWKLPTVLIAELPVLALHFMVDKSFRKGVTRMKRRVSFTKTGATREWQLRDPLMSDKAEDPQQGEVIICKLEGGKFEQAQRWFKVWNPLDSTGHAAYAGVPELRAAQAPPNVLHELEFTIQDDNDQCQGIAVGVTSFTESATWLCGYMPYAGCMVEATCGGTRDAPSALPREAICKPPLVARPPRREKVHVKMRIDFDERSVMVRTGEGNNAFVGFSGKHGGHDMVDGKFEAFPPADVALYAWVRLPVTAGGVKVGFTHSGLPATPTAKARRQSKSPPRSSRG